MSKVLVVDDEKPISDIIKFNLTKEGYDVVTAADGQEALDMYNDENPDLVLEKAVKNVTPQVEVKARRVGGSTYQVPIEIRAYRGTNISLKWITEFARGRSGKSMSSKLANEVMDAAKEAGNAIRRKEQTHKMAEANKAFAHFKY